jgi:hypothetical protein
MSNRFVKPLPVLLLAASLVTAFFWRSGYQREYGNEVGWRHSNIQYDIAARRGILMLGRTRIYPEFPIENGWIKPDVVVVEDNSNPWIGTLAGLFVGKREIQTDCLFYKGVQIRIPFWFLECFILALFARTLKKFRSIKTTSTTTHCTECNYDLRAHSPGSACPECGTRNAGMNVTYSNDSCFTDPGPFLTPPSAS